MLLNRNQHQLYMKKPSGGPKGQNEVSRELGSIPSVKSYNKNNTMTFANY